MMLIDPYVSRGLGSNEIRARRTTVGQALYQSLKLPLPMHPAEHPLPLLIYGGSTATGTLAVQFAKLQVSEPDTFERL